MNNTKLVLIAMIGIFCFACNEKESAKNPTQETQNAPATTETPAAAEKADSKNSFTDARDGKTYKIVKIGEQVWMSENLNYDDPDFDSYKCVTDYCDKYGRLYTWEQAIKACPSGWHLPSNAEWDKLVHYVDGTNGTESPYISETAGKLLKAKEGWEDYEGKSGNGTDNFGFSALPGGYDGMSENDFSDGGDVGFWWSSANEDSSSYGRNMSCIHDGVYSNGSSVYAAYSIRCIQDKK